MIQYKIEKTTEYEENLYCGLLGVDTEKQAVVRTKNVYEAILYGLNLEEVIPSIRLRIEKEISLEGIGCLPGQYERI